MIRSNMRVQSKAISVLVLSLFLIGNVVIFLDGNSIPSANALALSTGGFPLPFSGGFSATPQAATVSCDSNSNGIVTVTKVISDPSNIASGTANTLSFEMTLTN